MGAGNSMLAANVFGSSRPKPIKKQQKTPMHMLRRVDERGRMGLSRCCPAPAYPFPLHFQTIWTVLLNCAATSTRIHPGALDLRPSPSGPAGHRQRGSSTRETSEEQDHHFRLCTREFQAWRDNRSESGSHGMCMSIREQLVDQIKVLPIKVRLLKTSG